MKIAIVITSLAPFSNGIGGSYRSALILAEALANRLGRENVVLVNLGNNAAISLKDAKCETVFIKYRPWSFISYIMEINRVLSENKIDLLHAFDNKSYFFCRIFSLYSGSRLVITRPGGPDPKWYFPKAKSIVLFSSENKAFLERKKKHRNASIAVLPQRISEVVVDMERVSALRAAFGVKELVVLRIGRFCERYEEAGRQTLRLGRFLRQNGVLCRVMIVGTIEEDDVRERLQKECTDLDHLIHDIEYTSEASRILPVADLVVGTGRGILEAAYVKLPVLCAAAGSELPILINSDNFEQLAKNNFSPRSTVENCDPTANEADILKIVVEESVKREVVDANYDMVSRAYAVEGAIDKYLQVYNASSAEAKVTSNVIDLVLNSLQCAQYYLRSDWVLWRSRGMKKVLVSDSKLHQ